MLYEQSWLLVGIAGRLLNTPWNITSFASPQWGGWVIAANRPAQPVKLRNRYVTATVIVALCYSTSQGRWWEQSDIPCHLINSPQQFHRFCCGSNADLVIYIAVLSLCVVSASVWLLYSVIVPLCFCKSSHMCKNIHSGFCFALHNSLQIIFLNKVIRVPIKQ